MFAYSDTKLYSLNNISKFPVVVNPNQRQRIGNRKERTLKGRERGGERKIAALAQAASRRRTPLDLTPQ